LYRIVWDNFLNVRLYDILYDGTYIHFISVNATGKDL
jgi:hypothetical protein